MSSYIHLYVTELLKGEAYKLEERYQHKKSFFLRFKLRRERNPI